MKWLIDEMLSDSIADALNDRGHDAVSVASLGIRGTQDSSRVAQHLDTWTTKNPDPFRGLHWP